ncbi:MAG TPA: GNAT family N-acetyltransferase [Solirubrobacteraceae bacterium]|jgi:putative acetyltransferase|nr:GNAT family N-acetyltransferase [Solirubrobacteraceae bacterium]
MPGVEVRPEPLDSPVARRLIAELNAELSRDYPPAQRFHSLAAEEVAEGAGAFLVLWLDGAPAGCGAVRILSPEGPPPVRIQSDGIPAEAVAELKRMYVVPTARGRGLSRLVLRELEARAAALGASRLVLETGDKALAALGLYESAGYARLPCFGAYAASPTSICLEKRLAC